MGPSTTADKGESQVQTPQIDAEDRDESGIRRVQGASSLEVSGSSTGITSDIFRTTHTARQQKR